MQAATPAVSGSPGMKQNRVFILSSLSIGHGLSHMFDQGFPLLITEIAAAMGLGTYRTAVLFAMRQGGSSATSLGGGPFIDYLKSYWGIILTACMLVHAITFALIGVAPTFPVLVVVVLFLSMPGSLWHLPAAAAISQRFPERRGFAIFHARLRVEPGQRERPGDCRRAAGSRVPHLAARVLHLRRPGRGDGGVGGGGRCAAWAGRRAGEANRNLWGQFGNAVALLKTLS